MSPEPNACAGASSASDAGTVQNPTGASGVSRVGAVQNPTHQSRSLNPTHQTQELPEPNASASGTQCVRAGSFQNPTCQLPEPNASVQELEPNASEQEA